MPQRFVLLLALLLGCGRQPAAPAPAPGQAGTTVSREEFRKLVEGKTRDEVLQALGKPDKTAEGDALETWTYRRQTLDSVTGKAGRAVLIHFDRKTGRVESVRID